MKLSVMLFPLHRQLSEGTRSAAEVVACMKAEGITAIEPAFSWIEAEPARWAEFDRAARDAGMAYSCCDIIVNLVGESDADRAAALDLAVRGVEFCRDDLHCPIGLLAGTKPADGMSDAEGRRVYGQALAEVARRTQNSGVTVAIEDFGMYPTFTASAADCLETLGAADCPDVKFVFDNGNFLLGDDTPMAAYPQVKDRTVHVHIKDFELVGPDGKALITTPSGKGYASCAIGAGAGQVAECLDRLKADGYDAWVSLEVGGPGDPLDHVVQGARFVRQAWGED